MGFLKSLFSIGKMNTDPDQQALAKMFIDIAEGRLNIRDAEIFLQQKKWSRSDIRTRVPHVFQWSRFSGRICTRRLRGMGKI
jgi:hypothetical protein